LLEQFGFVGEPGAGDECLYVGAERFEQGSALGGEPGAREHAVGQHARGLAVVGDPRDIARQLCGSIRVERAPVEIGLAGEDGHAGRACRGFFGVAEHRSFEVSDDEVSVGVRGRGGVMEQVRHRVLGPGDVGDAPGDEIPDASALIVDGHDQIGVDLVDRAEVGDARHLRVPVGLDEQRGVVPFLCERFGEAAGGVVHVGRVAGGDDEDAEAFAGVECVSVSLGPPGFVARTVSGGDFLAELGVFFCFAAEFV
jgi:hypothetical protein